VGHPPFTGDNPVSVAYQHVREEARPPSELNPNVPASVDAVVMKALAKNPENRYHSAGEMREDLIRAARGQAVMAPSVMDVGDRTQLIGDPDSTAPIKPIATSSSKRRPWLIAMGVILALVAVAAAGWGIMQAMDTPAMVQVPNVIDQLEADAVTTLQGDGFEVETARVIAEDPKDPAIGKVIDQDPKTGAEQAEGSTVKITVMDAPAPVTVEDVVNDPVGEAQKTLEDQGLVVVVNEIADTAEPGTVLSQDPEGGTVVDIKTTVTLTVSEGGQATVPNVVGRTVESAKAELEAAGFTWEVEYGNQAGATEGVVYEQAPGGGSTEADGTTITITAQGVVVSWDATTTPQALMDTLNTAGLTAVIEGDATLETIESVSGPDGALTSGTAVAPGSQITIVPAEEDDGGGGGQTSDDASPTCINHPIDTPPCAEDEN
jgi:serine/threonine-protein kinase